MPTVLRKSLPRVSMVAVPTPAGAVQVHQTDFSPETPALSGSPASAVALKLKPVSLALVPLSGVASAKLSLDGAAEIERTTDPVCCAVAVLPSTEIRYVVPGTAVKV